jgi:hypothetical protein
MTDIGGIGKLNHACQSGRHPNADRGFDLYETPAIAVEELIRVESLPLRIWEPAAGRGAIVRVLQGRGHDIIASDIVDYGFPLDFVADFLAITTPPADVDTILTNPPFKILNKFVDHALDLCARAIMLVRLAYYEGVSVRRTEILEHRGLARVHVFRKRLPMMHRDDWTGKRSTSAMPFAWFCWERGHQGPVTFDRIGPISAPRRKIAKSEIAP